MTESLLAHVTQLAATTDELVARTDNLAEKLAAITLALVNADTALSKRVERLEQMPTTRIAEVDPAPRKPWWRKYLK